MIKAEARRLILKEWPNWRANNLFKDERASGTDAFTFFGYLQQKMPHLLDFPYPGDKWQQVHSWLLQDGLVSD